MAGTQDYERALDSRRSWVVVAFGFLSLTVLWGSVFTFTVYADALATAFGLSAIRTSAVFSIGTAAFFIAGGSVGILVDRLPLRPVVIASGIAVAAAVLLLQTVSTFWGLAAAFGLYGVAGGTTFVIVLSLVPQWFDRYEGRAMGLTVAGNGIGVQVFPFIWLWLFERTSIQGAFLVVGGAATAVVLAAAILFRRPPGRRGTSGAAAVDFGWLRSLLSNPRFLAAWPGLVLVWAWYFVLSAGMVDILTGAGIGRSIASTAFGLIGGISIATRIGSGGLADWIGPRPTLTGGVALTALGLFVLGTTTTVSTMYLALVTFGVGLGAIAALYAPIVIRAFGPENATAVTGIFTYGSATAGFLGPIAMDAVAGAIGGYSLPLIILGVMTLLGAGLFHWGTKPTTRAAAPRSE